MRVLGIDLSQNATGLAMIGPPADWSGILEKVKLEADVRIGYQDWYYFGALILPRSTNVLTRWDEILLPALDWAKHAQHIMIEGYSFGSMLNRARGVIEIGGILRYHLRKMGHIPIEIAPASLKKFLTDNGRAKKNEIVKAVRKQVPSIHDHNMADAFGLAQIGIGIYGERLEFPKHQTELIWRITHPEDKPTKQQRNRIAKFEKQNANQETLDLR